MSKSAQKYRKESKMMGYKGMNVKLLQQQTKKFKNIRKIIIIKFKLQQPNKKKIQIDYSQVLSKKTYNIRNQNLILK